MSDNPWIKASRELLEALLAWCKAASDDRQYTFGKGLLDFALEKGGLTERQLIHALALLGPWVGAEVIKTLRVGDPDRVLTAARIAVRKIHFAQPNGDLLCDTQCKAPHVSLVKADVSCRLCQAKLEESADHTQIAKLDLAKAAKDLEQVAAKLAKAFCTPALKA